MKRSVCAVLALGLSVVWAASADLKELQQEFMARCKSLIAERIPTTAECILGKEGWVVLWTEMAYLSTPVFWGPEALKVNPACTEENADPVPAMVDFQKKLAARDIDLIVIPVPARPLIYPESVLGKEKLAGYAKTPYLYPPQREFFALMAKQGVQIIDLTPTFLARRDDPHAPLYIPSDTHWTGLAVSIAASEVAKLVKNRPWYKSTPREAFVTEWKEIEHFGHIYNDLKKQTKLPVRPPDHMWLRTVQRQTSKGMVDIDGRHPESPVVLIGDSNCYCWTPEHSGLAQQLSAELGFQVDWLATSGGGASNVRIELIRRTAAEPGYLESKKLVVWVFTSRGFENTTDCWNRMDLPSPLPPTPAIKSK